VLTVDSELLTVFSLPLDINYQYQGSIMIQGSDGIYPVAFNVQAVFIYYYRGLWVVVNSSITTIGFNNYDKAYLSLNISGNTFRAQVSGGPDVNPPHEGQADPPPHFTQWSGNMTYSFINTFRPRQQVKEIPPPLPRIDVPLSKYVEGPVRNPQTRQEVARVIYEMSPTSWGW